MQRNQLPQYRKKVVERGFGRIHRDKMTPYTHWFSDIQKDTEIAWYGSGNYQLSLKTGNWKFAATLAEEANAQLALKVSDWDTPLVPEAVEQAHAMALKLCTMIELPDVIFVSPYKRTWETLRLMYDTWPELKGVKIYEEDRIREKECGHALLYNDWKIYFALHPEERRYCDLVGNYMYAFPRGENIPRVRERNRSWISTLVREYAEKRVMAMTHFINIIALRSNFERLSRSAFEDLDQNNKPINCGVTLYRGDPESSENGRLVLEFYNMKLY